MDIASLQNFTILTFFSKKLEEWRPAQIRCQNTSSKIGLTGNRLSAEDEVANAKLMYTEYNAQST